MARSKSPTPLPAPDRLAEARRRLDEFEGSATQPELLARLRATNPLHPFLVVRALAIIACFTGGIATVMSLLVPWIDRGLAREMVALETLSGLPIPVALGILTVCAGAVLATAQIAATSAARNAPWRPQEAKVYQRLASDIRQLEAELTVRDRLTPRSASPRALPRG